MVELRDLRAFGALAAELHFGRAAVRELAAALPGALRQLERTLEATRAAAEGGWEI
jgi:hypothetical protein